ncbi:MAG: hypothetical protein FIA95_05860, partial [Gemmatimonadetes bacterium]|nr:hypothetical protein [Gemmatimonadota bacterium]
MPRALAAAAGWTLLVAAYTPLHRLLDPARTGTAGAATRASAENAWSLGVWGSVVTGGRAAVLALAVRADPAAWGSRAARKLARIPAGALALSTAGAAFLLSAAAAWAVFGRAPLSVDEMVQLLHARVLLSGAPALALPGDPAAWLVQNSLLTPSGWASVYPPLHTLLLAGGMAAGAAWLVGPLGVGAAVGLVSLSLVRLMPERPGLARAAAVAVALAPFTLLLGATHLSHPTAAAFTARGLWAAVRARDGGTGWAVLAGAAAGASVCTRPWTGLALSA